MHRLQNPAVTRPGRDVIEYPPQIELYPVGRTPDDTRASSGRETNRQAGGKSSP
jgi:hypothetical protein